MYFSRKTDPASIFTDTDLLFKLRNRFQSMFEINVLKWKVAECCLLPLYCHAQTIKGSGSPDKAACLCLCGRADSLGRFSWFLVCQLQHFSYPLWGITRAQFRKCIGALRKWCILVIFKMTCSIVNQSGAHVLVFNSLVV